MKRSDERVIARMEKRQAGESVAQVIEDPVTVGLDRTINVDMTKLPTPPNVYDADYAWIEHRPGTVSLFFGKRNRDEADQLRTRLELRYPPENLVGHFWGNSRQFHEKLREFAGKWPKDEERSGVNPTRMRAVKEHSEWANFDAMAHAGTEASIDFYLMPPSGIARFARGQGSAGLKFAPIVRVQLTIFELLRLLDETANVVKQIEGYLPKRDRVDEEIAEERA